MDFCVTVDLDNYPDYQSLVDTSLEGDPISFYDDAIPRYLDLFDRAGIRATFFMVGRDARVAANRARIREVTERGHEVGNHSYTHPYAFRKLSRKEKEAEIDQGSAAIADVLGAEPVGFRTPSCELDEETLGLLRERGYLYDSSVFPSPMMWIFMLYGKLFVRRADYQLGEIGTVFAPGYPYFPAPGRLRSAAEPVRGEAAPLVEIPVSVVPVVRIPFYSTMLRLLGERAFELMIRARSRERLLHVLFHLIELADFRGTQLDEAMGNAPGVGVSAERRMAFVEHAMPALAKIGTSITMRQAALSHLARYGLESA